MNWMFNHEDYSPNNTALLPEGKYRVCITDAKETVANNGTQGLKISLKINGHSNKLTHYIWYNHDQVARTNQLIGEFFASFNIHYEEIDQCDKWIGKYGGVRVIHAEYKGRLIAKVAFCLSQEQQKGLPDWTNAPCALEDEIVCELSRVPASNHPTPPRTPVRNYEDFRRCF